MKSLKQRREEFLVDAYGESAVHIMDSQLRPEDIMHAFAMRARIDLDIANRRKARERTVLKQRAREVSLGEEE